MLMWQAESISNTLFYEGLSILVECGKVLIQFFEVIVVKY